MEICWILINMNYFVSIFSVSDQSIFWQEFVPLHFYPYLSWSLFKSYVLHWPESPASPYLFQLRVQILPFLSIYLSLWLPPNTLLPHSCVFSIILLVGLPRWSSGKKKKKKNLPANAGETGLIPGSGRSPGGGDGNPLQYSHLGNPMDRGAWRATVPRLAESDTTEWVSTHTLYLPLESNIDNYLIFYFLLECKFCEDCIVLSVFVPMESSASKRVLGG